MSIYRTQEGYWIAEGSFLGRKFIIEGGSWSEVFTSAADHMKTLAGIKQ